MLSEQAKKVLEAIVQGENVDSPHTLITIEDVVIKKGSKGWTCQVGRNDTEQRFTASMHNKMLIAMLLNQDKVYTDNDVQEITGSKDPQSLMYGVATRIDTSIKFKCRYSRATGRYRLVKRQ